MAAVRVLPSLLGCSAGSLRHPTLGARRFLEVHGAPPTQRERKGLARAVTYALVLTLGGAGVAYYSAASQGGSSSEAPTKIFEKAKSLASSATEQASFSALSKDEWRTFKVKDVKPYAYNARRIIFELPEDSDSGLTIASALLTQSATQGGCVEENGKPAIRPYTPVSSPSEKGHIDLLVKEYPTGKMSRHINSLKPGDELKLKGPIPKFPYKANEFEHLGMIAGGSGITPMWQVMQAIDQNPQDRTKVTLLFANQTERDILLKKEFENMMHRKPDQFKVVFFVDQAAPKGWKGEVGYINEEMIKKYFTPLMPGMADKIKLFVCGPPPQVESVCGNKKSPSDQGDLKGILADMGYAKDQVYKMDALHLLYTTLHSRDHIRATLERVANLPLYPRLAAAKFSMSDEPTAERRFAENRLRAKAAFLENERQAQAVRASSTVPAKRRAPLEVTPADSTSPTAPSARHFASTTTSDSTISASDAFQRAVTPGNRVTGRSASAAAAGSSSKGLGISGSGLIGPTRSYVDYDLSTLKNSKGGFLVDEEEDNERELKQRHRVEELRKERLRDLQKKGATGEDPALTGDKSAHAQCENCGSVELDFQLHRIYGVPVCPKCKHDKPDRYSLLTKTECKEDYLLTDPELRDEDILPHMLKRNPHSDHSNMLLFLRCQVEKFAFEKWGSPEALDAEFARREEEKKRKKGKKFEAKLAELRRKTRANTWHKRQDEIHVHDYGGNDSIVRDAQGNQVQVCKLCGFEVQVETF